MTLRHLPVMFLVAASLGACKNIAPDADAAARIIDPTAASRAALQAAVNEELGTTVLLADDALTSTSLLIIERNPPQTMDNRASGRTLYPPIQFRLVKSGEQCILVDTRDESRKLLADTHCSAE